MPLDAVRELRVGVSDEELTDLTDLARAAVYPQVLSERSRL